ncbi:alkaline phosphatase [Microbacterium sp. 4R-513]|uniref:choice-of-anchor I family protein n=1 Tax=Microbacterium sp. 4R-513 TaxID=2567934 RepID=UPI0013E103FA|nr:choice-of-anchor I family protein [Microbacterium sp. 4R-513]QIG39280.1 alkaline phosphatase [Microbacterium sp. 4R-513]
MPSHFRRAAVLAAAAAATCSFALAPAIAASAEIVPDPIEYSAPGAVISLTPVGSYDTGAFDESAAEIVAHFEDKLFVVSAKAGSVQVLDFSDPASIGKEYEIGSDGVANSVAIREDGLGIAAFEAPTKTDPGHLVFFDARADRPTVLGTVTVGAQPDNVVITPDGRFALTANEGEPADDFSTDPEGSVSVVRLSTPKVIAARQKDVSTADFHAYENGALPDGVRVFGPTPNGGDRPVSRNLEPEYISIVGNTAYVALQEANAIAVVQIPSARVTDILPLGFKDHGVVPLDPSDRDGSFALRTYPGLYGVYLPDGIGAYRSGGASYLVTANEGDAREWGSYAEGARAGSLPICPDSPLAGKTGNADLGRLNVTKELGFDQAKGCYSSLYTFGTRSFSIWGTDGTQVFDSGSQLEEITYAAEPAFVNSNHTEPNLEGRSDDKGPEPENLVIGEVDDRTYAFIGLERVGGVVVYDITVPAESFFVTYLNNRDFSDNSGDLGPEGLSFIPADESPTGSPLLAVANEVSGSTTLLEVGVNR